MDLHRKKGKLTEGEALVWIRDIVRCYKVLLRKNIMHRDLKPVNILYIEKDDKYIFKIADFGLARHIGISAINTIGRGTLAYIAP